MGASSRVTSSTTAARSTGTSSRGRGREHAQALEDRVDGLVEAVDLGERLALPVGRVRLLRRLRCLTAQQLDVRAHDRQRRPQGVGHDRDEVGARLVDGAQAFDLRLGLALEPALLDDAGEQAGERLEEARRRRA